MTWFEELSEVTWFFISRVLPMFAIVFILLFVPIGLLIYCFQGASLSLDSNDWKCTSIRDVEVYRFDAAIKTSRLRMEPQCVKWERK